MRQISESIAHDGKHFFCLRCGKSGYTKMAQVKGHLAMCPGTAIRKGAIPPSPSALGSELCCEQVQLAPASPSPAAGAFSMGFSDLANYQQQQQQLRADVNQLKNEAHHMMMSRNQPEPVGDWFGRNKGIIIIGAIVLFAVIMMNQNRQCPSVSGSGGGKAVGNIGEKALTKLMDRGISKAVDSIFK